MITKDIFALDIGTTKFCLAVLKSEAPFIDTISVPAQGMRRGMLTNFEKAREALNTLIIKAEDKFQKNITRVIVGVAGSHMLGRVVKSKLDIGHCFVKQATLKKFINHVEVEFVDDQREILHIVPICYQLDNRELIEDPLGFSGKSLFGKFFVIDADKHYLKDVIRLCNQCGLEVTRLVSEPVASASVTVSEEKKNIGVALADIGGGTTDGLIFKAGKSIASFSLNVAGKMMTNDLSIGLRLPKSTAEKIKIHFGLLTDHQTKNVSVTDIFGSKKIIGWKDVYPILMPRAQELGTLLLKQLNPFKNLLPGGILLTGGCSDLKGFAPFLKKELNLPVSHMKPMLNIDGFFSGQFNGSQKEQEFNSRYATVIGLLNIELLKQKEECPSKKLGLPRKYIGTLVNWIKEMS